MAEGEIHADRPPLGARTPLGQTFLSPKFLSPLGARSLTVLQPLPLPGAEPLGETVQRQPAPNLGPGEAMVQPQPVSGAAGLQGPSPSTPPTVQRQADRQATRPNLQRQTNSSPSSPTPSSGTLQIQRQTDAPAPSAQTPPNVQRQAVTASSSTTPPSVQRQEADSASSSPTPSSGTPQVQRQTDAPAPSAQTPPALQRQADGSPTPPSAPPKVQSQEEVISSTTVLPDIQRQPLSAPESLIQPQIQADSSTSSPEVQQQAGSTSQPSPSSSTPDGQAQAEPAASREPTVAQLLAENGSIPEVPRSTGRSLNNTPIQRDTASPSSTPNRWSTLAQLMGDSSTDANKPSPEPTDTVVQRFLEDDEGTEPDRDEEEGTHPLHAAVLRALENVEGIEDRDEFLFKALAGRFEEDDTAFGESFVNTWREYIEDEDEGFKAEFITQSLEIDIDSLIESELSQNESDERLLNKLAARLGNADDNFLIALAAVIHEADVIFPDDDLLEEEANQNIEMLAREMYSLLRQRLALERERQGVYYTGRLL